MAMQTPSEMQRAGQARERAHALWQSGLPVAQIQERLVLEGVDPQVARSIAQDLMVKFGQAFKESGRKHMLYGTVWVVLALLVTGITFLGALGTDKPYLFAWGLAAFGAIQAIRGLYQYGRGRATIAHYATNSPSAPDDHSEQRHRHG